VVFLKEWLSYIPMAALVAIMIMVAFTTFNWDSIKNFSKHPKQSNSVMLAVVVIVLMTHNLALGVLIGVLLSALFLVNKLENAVRVQSHLLNSTTRKYEIFGQIFFSSSEKFFQFFDFNESVDHVIIDLTHAHIWDITSVSMLNQVQNKFLQNNIQVETIGMNEASRSLVAGVFLLC
jgi:SulP family sulfate permease